MRAWVVLHRSASVKRWFLILDLWSTLSRALWISASPPFHHSQLSTILWVYWNLRMFYANSLQLRPLHVWCTPSPLSLIRMVQQWVHNVRHLRWWRYPKWKFIMTHVNPRRCFYPHILCFIYALHTTPLNIIIAKSSWSSSGVHGIVRKLNFLV